MQHSSKQNVGQQKEAGSREPYTYINVGGTSYRYLASFNGQHAHVLTKTGNDGLEYKLGTDAEIKVLMDFLKKNTDPKLGKLGSRYNTGKLPLDLLDPLAMEACAAVLQFGAKKYAAHNWRSGLHWMGIVSSLLRHLYAFIKGEDLDSETGLPHVDHVLCNAMFLSNLFRTRKDLDDRYKSGKES